MAFECAVRTHVGCRRRINEDAVLSRPELGLWAVADGMGGHDAGEVASALVVDSLGKLGPGLALAERAMAAGRALAGVNKLLIAMASEGSGGRTIGSTVVALLVGKGAFVCLWAGDSRIYRARGGVLQQLTRDHSLVQELVDLGELAPDDAEGHPNANVITRAVGVDASLDLDSIEGDVRPGDVFLLASDGLTRLVSNAELLAGLQGKALEETADSLLATCLERNAPDNVSMVILRAR
jgi:serine/threonine protein phosphatase Stp1